MAKKNDVEIKQVMIEDTRVIFRNFSGKPSKYNTKGGKRSVGVVLPSLEDGEKLKQIGWNVKELMDRDTGLPDTAYLSAKVRYDNKPPKIVLVTNRGQTPLDVETVGMLDYADIVNVDVVLSPFPYDVNGNTGISAYVKTMYVTVQEDEFTGKYDREDFDVDASFDD